VDAWATGRPEQETNTRTCDSNASSILSGTDPFWRTTALTYFAIGNEMGVTRLSGTSSAVSARFVYPLGRRMSKTIGGIASQFLYDGWNPVQELQNGSPSANLLTGLGIDEYFRRTDSAGSRDFLTDVLGSTLALSDATGTAQTTYTYEPFGNTTASGVSNINLFQFTGRENDGAGLYFYRARYYSPTFQRFIAQDPIGVAGSGANLYAYADQSPLDATDPFGLTTITFDPGRGILTVDPEQPGRDPYDISASSGRPGCRCGPSDPNNGRIPSGDYSLLTSEFSYPSYFWDLLRELRGDWGSFRVPLHPDPATKTFGRKGFFLHGGLFPGSAGCIDAGGGIFGNADTKQLVSDILADPDGTVPVHVK
jgi:RHS repeat-associated protein